MSDKQRQLEAMKNEREMIAQRLPNLQERAKELREAADRGESEASKAEEHVIHANSALHSLNLQILLAEFILS